MMLTTKERKVAADAVRPYVAQIPADPDWIAETERLSFREDAVCSNWILNGYD